MPSSRLPRFGRLILLCPLLLGAPPARADEAAGAAAWQRGELAAAARQWQQAAARAGTESRHPLLLQAAQALIEAGFLDRAEAVIAELRAEGADTSLAEGCLRLRRGDPAGAVAPLLAAGRAAPAAAGSVALALGDAHAALGDEVAARRYYGEAVTAADPLTSARARVRLAALLPPPAAAAGLERAAASAADLPAGHDRAFLELALAEAWGALHRPREGQAAFEQALATATAAGELRALARAAGALSELRHQDAPDEALALSRRALFAAQEAQAPELAYRYEWQIARLLERAGDREAALAAWGRAVAALESVRPEVAAALPAGSSFRAALGELYSEYADRLLERAAAGGGEADLIAARDVLERLRQAELQEYFQDDCVAAFLAKRAPLDRLSATTAVLYFALFEQRTVLLLHHAGGVRQFTVPVGRRALAAEAEQLRLRLEKRTSRQFLPHARQLHAWLIAPAEPALKAAGVDTLVLVPDGPLRTIPLAALHDGERFLVDRYATAVTPGLTLIDPRPLPGRPLRILLGGLTDSVQGFAPLPNVTDELASVEALLGGEVLKNDRFVVPAVERELGGRSYDVVHIASHGQFGARARDSFLLTFDDRLDMNRLEQLLGTTRLREEAVELLTLSACQTAAGDERAALGLAGVAVKAGARSALASLWFINDRASAALVTEFYRQLARPGTSRARALQLAQQSLLKEPRYSHPAYWAPFLVIGNWL